MTDYVELHCHSCYSLLDGASSLEDLVARAAALRMNALALTDHDGVYGAPHFVRLAREAGLRPILGAEISLESGGHLTLLVRNETGWRNLCHLITAGRHRAAKGEAALPDHLLEPHAEGLIALSGCRRGAIPSALLGGDRVRAEATALNYARWFGREHFWIELQHHRQRADRRLIHNLVNLAQRIGVGYVATNNVHYATRSGHTLQNVLVCIRHNTTLDEAAHLRPNSECYLKSGEELVPLFARYPDALTRSRRIAEQCDFELHYGLQELPIFPLTGEMSADAYLRHLCLESASQRGLPATTHEQIDHELAIICESGLSNYFLIVWDIVRFAREQNILCQGRGSAANSLVAYLLGISPVNPLEQDLVFERFLSSERQATPDIDIDFDAARREEVIQYVYGRYGLDHAAMACTLVTFRARSAIRDVGKALGFPPDLLDSVTTALDVSRPGDLHESASLRDTLGLQRTRQNWEQVFDLCQQIDGFPRHLGIHNGGMVITGRPLSHRVPTEPATMTDRYVTQWDKEALEDVGLVKIDLLGLRMLSAVADACAIVAEMTGERPALERLSYDDPAVYDMICAADTVGVFQVESRAQAQVLPRLQPRCFADLIVSISLIRPGPIQGDMVHPYLRRRLGEEPVSYFHPLLEPALRETLGVILFQEQVLKVARDLAGFTPGQGEILRRALGSRNPDQAVERFREGFLTGAEARGVDRETAGKVFDRLRAFGGYSFPKSHAASFAVLVYRSAWLKRYHPHAFLAALLNNQPMGFWSPGILVSDARRHGIPVRRVDINRSQWNCTVEAGAIRLGFNYVHGFGETVGQQIVAARAERPFADLAEFCQRAQLSRHLVENLIGAGAMDGWGNPRRDLIWELGTLRQMDGGLGLTFPSEPVTLPALTEAEAAGMEVAMTGLSTGPHPLTFQRERLQGRGILSSLELHQRPVGAQVEVAGLLVVHQSPPTAKGFHFLTLEDEDGFINVIVRPRVYARFRRIIRTSPLLWVEGELQREGEVVNVIARRIRPEMV